MPRGRPRKIIQTPTVEDAGEWVTIKATVAADLHLGDGRVIHSGSTAQVPAHVASDLIEQGKVEAA